MKSVTYNYIESLLLRKFPYRNVDVLCSFILPHLYTAAGTLGTTDWNRQSTIYDSLNFNGSRNSHASYLVKMYITESNMRYSI